MKSIWKTIALCATSAILTLSVFFNIFFLTVFEIHDADSFKQALLSKEILEEILDGFTNIETPEDELETNNPTIDSPTPDTDEPEPEVPSIDEPEEDTPTVDVPTHELIMCYDEIHHWVGCTNGDGCCSFPKDEHTGGTATATERAICEECGQPYGELLDEPTVDTPIGLQEGQVVYDANGITITYLNQEEGVLGPQFNFYIVNNSEYTLWVSCTEVYIDGVQADLSGGGVSDIESGKKAYLEFTIWESDYENFTNDPSEVEFDLVVRDDSNWDELDRLEDLILKLK